jgi:hypothetical protein
MPRRDLVPRLFPAGHVVEASTARKVLICRQFLIGETGSKARTSHAQRRISTAASPYNPPRPQALASVSPPNQAMPEARRDSTAA